MLAVTVIVFPSRAAEFGVLAMVLTFVVAMLSLGFSRNNLLRFVVVATSIVFASKVLLLHEIGGTKESVAIVLSSGTFLGLTVGVFLSKSRSLKLLPMICCGVAFVVSTVVSSAWDWSHSRPKSVPTYTVKVPFNG